MLSKRILGIGLIYTGIAFACSLFVGLYAYRFVWINAPRASLVSWFAIFDISQFLLLLDIGFTHDFIKRHVNSPVSILVESIPNLRGILLYAGTIAGLAVLIAALILNRPSASEFLPYLFLSISIALTLLSYAETAVFRVELRFALVYKINIIASLIYGIIIYINYGHDAITSLSVATLVRAIIQFLVQIYYSNIKYRVKFFPNILGSSHVISLNVSYFVLFMADLAIMKALGISSSIIAIIIIIRKYYDTLRSFWDALLNVLSVDFANSSTRIRLLILRVGIIVSFVIAAFLMPLLIKLWLGKFDTEASLSFSLMVAVCVLTLYRVETVRLYYINASRFLFPLVIALVTKLVFGFMLYIKPNAVDLAYLFQAGLVGTLTAIIVISSKQIHKHNASENYIPR